VVGQATPVRAVPDGPTSTGADQVCPFHWSAWPISSTAVQKDDAGHETPVKEDGAPYVWGCVHELPFHCESPPEEDMQNEELTQEMAVTEPQSPLVLPQPPR